MRENEAIDLALKVHAKHILDPHETGDPETTIIQNIADLYKAGYEVIPVFRPKVSMGDLEKMKEEGVAY